MGYDGFVLKQETDNYFVRLRFVQDFEADTNTGVVPLPLPGEGAESSFLLAFSGEEGLISVSAFLFDDGVDISDVGSGMTAPSGTFPNGVKSVKDQILYWKDFIKKKTLGTKWTLSGGDLSGSVEVFLRRVNVPREASNPREAVLNVEFVIGEVV